MPRPSSFTDDTENNELAIHVADMLVREIDLGQRVEPSAAAALFSMRAAPAADIVAFYEAESGRSDSAYDFDRAEWAINRIGYAMLREGRIDDAVAVFALNVCEHPSSANAHDSLGNAYLERGDLDAALSSNGRVLEPEPSSQNARAMIERIETARGSGS